MLPALLLALACGDPATPPAPAQPATSGPRADSPADHGEYRTVDVATLKSSLDGGKVPVLIDVRTPQEFGRGHVPGARNIPIQELERRVGELDPWRGQEVWVVCRSGGRSAKASDILAKRGWTAVNVDGGTEAWVAAGHRVDL